MQMLSAAPERAWELPAVAPWYPSFDLQAGWATAQETNLYWLLRARGCPLPATVPRGGRPVDDRLPLIEQPSPPRDEVHSQPQQEQDHGPRQQSVAAVREDPSSPSQQRSQQAEPRLANLSEGDRKQRSELYQHLSMPSVACSPDGVGFQTRVFAHEGLVRRLARVPTPRWEEAHEGCVNAVSWNEAGTLLVSGSDDTRLCVYDVGSRSILETFETPHRQNIFGARFVPASGDTRLLSCSRDGLVVLTERQQEEQTLLWSSDEAIKRVVPLPGDPNVFFTCGEDREVRCFDLRVRPELYQSTRADLEIEDPINSMDVHGWFVALAADSLYCRVFDRRTFGGARMQVSSSGTPAQPRVRPGLHRLGPGGDGTGQYPSELAALSPASRAAVRRSYGVLPVAVFEPHYLPFTELFGSYHVTDVAFNTYNGAELLASYSGGSVELFDVRDPFVAADERQTRFMGGPRSRQRDHDDHDEDGSDSSDDGVGVGDSGSRFRRSPVVAGDEDEEDEDEEGDSDSDGEEGQDTENGGSARMAPNASPQRRQRRRSPPIVLPEGFSLISASTSVASSSSASDSESRTAVYDRERGENEGDGDDDDEGTGGGRWVRRCRDADDDHGQGDEGDGDHDGGEGDSSDGEVRPRSPSHSPPPTPKPRIISRLPREMRRFLPRQSFSGHTNVQTVKGCGFLGPRGEFVVSGSDSGRVWIWEKSTGRPVNVLEDADAYVVNVISPHPSRLELATSGIDSDVKLWQPVAARVNMLTNLEDLVEVQEMDRAEARGVFFSSLQRQMFHAYLARLHEAEDDRRSGSDASLDDRDPLDDVDDLPGPRDYCAQQ